MKPFSTFDADLASIRETREQMRDLRKGREGTQEPRTMIGMMRSLRRELIGDADYHAQVDADAKWFIQEKHRNPPPPKSVRERLKRWYGWGKRG